VSVQFGSSSLRTPVEELRERLGPAVGVEAVLPLDRHPRKLPPFLREFVVAMGELLLPLKQLVAGGLPFLSRSDPVVRHRGASSVGGPEVHRRAVERPRKSGYDDWRMLLLSTIIR
jgi:hypothetical protein